jgi:uncharacterized protein (TIGR04255 family)
VAGVVFDRVRPDGTLEWRVRADDRAIFVNCLDYTRWREVWARSRAYLFQARALLSAPDNPIVSILLQYVDVFEWQGDVAAYTLADLLRRESPYVPPSLWDKGPLWHLYQGWYRSNDLPVREANRLLERVHLDGVLDDQGRPTVKMDTFLNLEARQPLNQDSIDQAFEGLHNVSSRLIGDYITTAIAQRIGLDAKNKLGSGEA